MIMLGDLLNFRRGHDLPKTSMIEGKIPVVGSNGIIGYHNALTTKSPCLTIGRSGNIGTPLYINEDCWAHNTTLYVDDYKNNNPKYLYYLLKTLNLEHYGGGSAVPTLNRNHIHPILVNATENIIEQKAIAETLSCLDDKIEMNNKTNANLEQTAQAIFKSWFVDFEPFQDGEFVESELGMIPKGWKAQPIENIAEKVAMGPFGSNIKVETFVEVGVPIISGNHLRGLYLDDLGYNFITVEHARRLSNSLVYASDIIFTHAGNIGQVALIPNNCEYPYYVISQRQFYLRCDKRKAIPEYINYYFHSREGQGKLLANTTQTGVPSIARPSSHLKSIIVPMPPIEVQTEWWIVYT